MLLKVNKLTSVKTQLPYEYFRYAPQPWVAMPPTAGKLFCCCAEHLQVKVTQGRCLALLQSSILQAEGCREQR